MKSILIIAPGLGFGGTENFLIDLIKFFHSKYIFIVLSVDKNNFLLDKFSKFSKNIIFLPTDGILNKLFVIIKYRKIVKNLNPDIIQSFLYKSDTLTLFTPKSHRGSKIIWSIRHDKLTNRNKIVYFLISRALALFSNFIPAKICFNSAKSMQWHHSIGFNESKSVFIPNPIPAWSLNFELSRLNKKVEGLNRYRDVLVLGMASRFSQDKGHDLLLRAAEILKERSLNLRLTFCGHDTGKDEALSQYILQKYPEILRYCEFNGYLNEVELSDWYESLGIFILPSVHEGFPNVLLPAILANIPSISTRVGDVSIILKFEEFLTDSNPVTLSNKIISIFDTYQDSLLKIFERKTFVKNNYESDKIYSQYESMWKSLSDE